MEVIVSQKVNPNKKQWQAIYRHAQYQNSRQYAPITFYIAFRGGTQAEEQSIAREALSKNVLSYVLVVFD
ncbi:hypothetical protein [Phormidium nigroviride]